MLNYTDEEFIRVVFFKIERPYLKVKVKNKRNTLLTEWERDNMCVCVREIDTFVK